MTRNPFVLLYTHRHVLWSTSLDAIRQRYSASVLGITWTILYPLIFLGLYAIIYISVFQIKISGHSSFEYMLVIFAGLVPFLGFTEAVGSGVGAIVDNRSLLNNTMFPIELVPVKAVLSSSVTMFVGLFMLVGTLVMNGQMFWTQALLPLIVIVQLIFTIGLMWLLSMFNVFFRDVSTFVSPIILLLMLVSPIAYTIDMIPEKMMPFMYPNPLFYLIMLYRESLCYGRMPWDFLAIFTVVAGLIFLLGYVTFARLKGICADYV